MSESPQPYPRSELLEAEQRREILARLERQLPARGRHPLLVQISTYEQRCLADRLMCLAYLQLCQEKVERRRSGRTGLGDIIDRIVQNVRPHERGVLERCSQGANGEYAPDEELSWMTSLFGMQTSSIVVFRYAKARFGVDPANPDEERVHDLMMELYLRCLPVESAKKARKNQRKGLFSSYTPDKSFMAYLATCFRPKGLGDVFLRSIALDEHSRSVKVVEFPDELADPDEDMGDQLHRKELLAGVGKVPEFVLAHLDHGKRICPKCGRAEAWLRDARDRIPARLDGTPYPDGAAQVPHAPLAVATPGD